MSKKKIYLVTDPDGDRTAFDTENAAKKYVIQQAKKYDMLDEGYLTYVRNLMINKPDITPMSYNAYIDQTVNDLDELSEFEYFIEDLVIMTEDDIT